MYLTCARCKAEIEVEKVAKGEFSTGLLGAKRCPKCNIIIGEYRGNGEFEPWYRMKLRRKPTNDRV